MHQKLQELHSRFRSFRHRHTISFRHAFDGIVYAFNSQPNLKIHFLIATCVLIAGWIAKITPVEWLFIIVAIFMVLIAEMVNTAMEQTVDLITKEWRENAKFAKDVTAGTVLFAAIGSVVIGLIIFIPHLIALFR